MNDSRGEIFRKARHAELNDEVSLCSLSPQRWYTPRMIFSNFFAAAYVHHIDPFLIRFSDGFGIRWYGLSYLVGFYIAYLIISWMGRRGLSPLNPALASDFVFTAALGTVIGGRLGYCVFYAPNLLTQFTPNPPFWGVLAINQGGMASHGGIIGIIVACILFGKKHGITIPHLLDLTTLGGSVGIFFGRIANFINGELVGRPCSPDLPWAVKFPQDILLWNLEKLRSLSQTASLVGVEPTRWYNSLESARTDPAAQQFVENTINIIITKIQAGDIALRTSIRSVLVDRHPSQLYEALGEGAFVFVVLFLLWRLPRKPGVITGAFFVTYAVVRVLGEQFRMPDPQIGFQILGLTRGQILSLFMLMFGSIALWFWSMRTAPLIGGWCTLKEPHVEPENNTR